MLITVFGMWHSTQELPALPAVWRVCAVSAFPIAAWHVVHSPLFEGGSAELRSTFGTCGS